MRDAVPVEFDKADVEIIDYVMTNKLTKTSIERVVATINACKHAVQAQVEGDFVECGVWRGGNAIAAKKTFERLGSDKKVYLFDTFTGMTAPGDHDKTAYNPKSADERYRDASRDGYSDWNYASLEDVEANFASAGFDGSGLRFIKGDVLKTLAVEENLPAQVSVLRLDTDWYESTKVELETLYPRLSVGGSILIDDYGHWEGARKAVDEYFSKMEARRRPLLHFTDYTGRMGVKCCSAGMLSPPS